MPKSDNLSSAGRRFGYRALDERIFDMLVTGRINYGEAIEQWELNGMSGKDAEAYAMEAGEII